MPIKKIRCYLAGSFKPYDEFSDWRDYVIKKVGSGVDFHDPRKETTQGSIATFVYEDLKGVDDCDVVFYFLTKGEGDSGGSAEASRGDAKGKLVILCVKDEILMPHPFLVGMSRRILIGLDAGIQYLNFLAAYGLENEFKAAYDMLKQ